jgi:hypothetical protein
MALFRCSLRCGDLVRFLRYLLRVGDREPMPVFDPELTCTETSRCGATLGLRAAREHLIRWSFHRG